jgi:SNF2 family DNA or RNA helicase
MNYKFKTKPYAHQLTALEKSWNKETYAYFMEMGTGKTKVLIDNMAMLYDKGKIDGALIIAPKGVIKTWYEQELPTHLPKHIENVTVLWQPNITKKQQENLDNLFELGTDLHILIMNVEAFSTEKGVKFATKFLNSHKRIIQTVNAFQNLAELSEKVKGFSYRVLKEDCLDLPKKVYMKRQINLSADQQRLYDQMRKEALATLNGKTVTTMTALTQLMRLHQITCGHFTADDGSTQAIKNNRIDELMNVLDEIEGKAIIWAHYQYDIKNIIKEIVKVHGPGSIVDYYGLTPQSERQDNIKKFQEDDKCRFLVGTTQTGGYGITLTAANTVIYYSNGYDLEKRLQSEDRAHRIGQKKSVTYVDILTDKTVDEKIVKSLRKKINIASEVLGEELKEWI